jgi:hypothetical protein
LISSNCLSSISAAFQVSNPIVVFFLLNSSVQIFEVMTMIVFLKSIHLPLLSLSCHSSKIWSIIFKTSGEAFSISSKRITEYGFLLTASVSPHHSSYPTYPAGDQISFETENFSINSDISNLIIAPSSPK